MSINTKNDGSNKRNEARGSKPQTPVQKQVSETKRKAHDAQNSKK
jgi:hypothetical protein